jgi:hypothetical protein
MIDRQPFPELLEPLLGPPRHKLRLGLQSAFQSYEELNRFAQEVLSINLNLWTSPYAGLATNIDVLMTQMDQQGKAMQLVVAARSERPGNAALRQAEELLALTFRPYEDVQESAGVKNRLDQAGVESIIVASAGFASADDFISRLGEAEFRVCYISYAVGGGAKAYGTGFLIGSDLVMTNAHVIEHACPPRLPFMLSGDNIEVGFDFRNADSPVERSKLVPVDWLVASDPAVRSDGGKGLDYAILRLASPMGEAPIGSTSQAAKRGYFRPVAHDPGQNEPLLILQHPFDALTGRSSPMRLTIGFVSDISGTDIRHTANTLRGSSGAPVFNAHCEVIGVHYWGDDGFNAAKKMAAIRQDLASKDLAGLL